MSVSVVIPAYNYGRYVVDAVESAFAQTHAPLEVIVVDDGSTDDTRERLRPYASRIRLVHQENRGAAAALNRGIQLAQGEWIAWLSADDAFLPTKLEDQLAHAQRHPEDRLIYTDWCSVDAQGRVTQMYRLPSLPRRELVSFLFRYCAINGSTTLIRRECFQTHGLFAEDLRQAHDWDMWLRLARDYPFGHVPKVLLRYRWHGANLSAQADALAYNPEVLRRARVWYGIGH